MNEIVLIFTHSDSWFSRIVCWLTGSRWSHVAIGVRRYAPDGYLGGPMNAVLDARLGDGVQSPRSLEGFLKERPDHEAFAVPITNSDAAGSFLRAQIGAPYDRWALLSFFMPWRDWQDPEAWYCFELAAQALVLGRAGTLETTFACSGGVSGRTLYNFCKENGCAITL